MPKGIVKNLVDKMLFEKASFEEIGQASGWSKSEIWMYIDMVFRVQNPEFCKDNEAYFVWGIDEKETVKKR